MKYGSGESGKKVRLFVVALSSAVLVAGCSTVREKINLKHLRSENLSRDMSAIRQPAWEGLLSKELDLAQVWDLAQRYNLEFQINELESMQADEELAAAHLAKLPHLDANGAWNKRSNQGYTYSERFGSGELGNDLITSIDDNNTVLDLSLRWSVLDFGISYYRAKQKVLARQVVSERVRRARQKLALKVVKNYLRVAVARHGLYSAREALKAVKAASEKMHKLSKRGDVSRYKALQYESKLVALENAKDTLESELRSARLELAKSIGAPPGMQVKVKGIHVTAHELPAKLNAEHLVSTALNSRPELFEADLKEKITLEEVKAIALQRFPNLSAVTSLQYDSNSHLYESSWSNVGARLSWDLLSIPRLNHERKAKKKRAEVQRAERALLALSIMTEVHLANAAYQLAQNRYQRLEKELEIQKDMAALAKKRAKAGKMSAVDLIANEAALVQKRIQEARAYADWVEALQRVYDAAQVDIGNKPKLVAVAYRGETPDKNANLPPLVASNIYRVFVHGDGKQVREKVKKAGFKDAFASNGIVHAGAFVTKKRADEAAKSLKSAGLSAEVVAASQ